MRLTFGSLFSGIGGIDLGFERAGLSCSWQVEIDDYATRVLEKHWPDVRRYRDVKEVGSHNLEPVDVITGGFPCQPHSVAGKRKGAADDRNLWPEYLRIIKELQPTWVVGENVPGIITTYLDTVLSDLEGAGYEVATFNLPAAGFGANHVRYRLFIVAYTKRGSKRPRLRQDVQTQKWGGRPGDSSGKIAKRVDTCQGCGEDWRNWHDRHREDCGCIDPWDESDDPDFGWWAVEPNVGRVAHGVSHRVDRLKGLGNAVVPTVAEFIGRALMATLTEVDSG